ncbi:MAG: nickel pincer cofactor biosynthesis protein LarC [Planctomycetota bacterium]|jgi:uncharacterized protein (TIGR00299 family) protein
MAHAHGTQGGGMLLVEPFGGMAGDMFLAGLLNLGDPRFQLADLVAFAEAVVPGEASFSTETVWRGSLSGLHLDVRTPETGQTPHRGLADLTAILEGADLSSRTRDFAVRVLTRIAEAEGRVHGCGPEEVHFHEVGAVDTLVDVGGAALALDRLGVERAFITPPILGEGTVTCAHGEMPVPAPATAELLRGLPQRSGGGGGERCTPTGAALLAEMGALGRREGVSTFELPGYEWSVAAVGYGAGTRDPEQGPPNLLRVQLGAAAGSAAGSAGLGLVDEVRVNLDDLPAEAIGDLVQGLREVGALDVWTAPIFMKKDRPGVLLTALVRPEGRAAIAGMLFERSSTFGIRWSSTQRIEAGRQTRTLSIEGVEVRIKERLRPDYEGRSPDGTMDLFCEHEDAVRLARRLDVPLREAHARAIAEAASAAPR